MNPSVIVLNVCAAIFLALLFTFSTFLVVRFVRQRKQQLSVVPAKEVPLYEAQKEVALVRKSKYRLAAAK